MRKKILIFLSFIFFVSHVFAQNSITFTPLTQTVSGSSGEEITAIVRVNCYGNQYSDVAYNIVPIVIDGGFVNYTPSSGLLRPGYYKDIIFKFKKNVSSSSTIQYKFRATYNYSGDVDKDLIINVSYNISNPSPCNLPPPSNLQSYDIIPTYATLKWDGVVGSSGYQLSHGYITSPTTGINYTRNTTRTSGVLTDRLPPNTLIGWRVRSKCPNGLYSNQWSSMQSFTTLPECPNFYTVYINQGGVKDEKAINYINAKNNLYSSAVANYSAGNKVVLIPGFHAKSGSTFRAFIEGCTSSATTNITTTDNEFILIGKEEIKNEILKIDYINVYPNPIRNSLFIDSDKDILAWSITGFSGKEIYKGRGKVKRIDTQKLTKGTYILRVRFKNGEVITKKIVKE